MLAIDGNIAYLLGNYSYDYNVFLPKVTKR